MELTEFQVETRVAQNLPWRETLIMPVGDVQIGAQGCDLERLRRHVRWGVEQGAYFIGMGDYVDVMSPSNRAAWRGIKRYDSVTLAMKEMAEKHVAEFLSAIKGSEGRWLGILHGHHYYEFEDGTTSDTRIAQALGAPYLKTTAVIILRFKRHATTFRCLVWATHGCGGSGKHSSPLGRLESLSLPGFEADFYLMGHASKKGAVPVPRRYVSERPPYKVVVKKKYLVATGGFYDGYAQGNGGFEGSYVEKGMMAPTALGAPLLKVRPVHEHSGDRLDLNVEV